MPAKPPRPPSVVWRSHRITFHCLWSWRIFWRMARTAWNARPTPPGGPWLCLTRSRRRDGSVSRSGPPPYRNCGREPGERWVWCISSATTCPARCTSSKRRWRTHPSPIRCCTTGSGGCMPSPAGQPRRGGTSKRPHEARRRRCASERTQHWLLYRSALASRQKMYFNPSWILRGEFACPPILPNVAGAFMFVPGAPNTTRLKMSKNSARNWTRWVS